MERLAHVFPHSVVFRCPLDRTTALVLKVTNNQSYPIEFQLRSTMEIWGKANGGVLNGFQSVDIRFGLCDDSNLTAIDHYIFVK